MNKKILWIAGFTVGALLAFSILFSRQQSEKFIRNVANVEMPPGIRYSRIVTTGEISFVKIQGKGYQRFRDEIIEKNQMLGFSGGNTMRAIKNSFLRECDEVKGGSAIFVYGSNDFAVFAICRAEDFFYLIRLNL